MLLDEMARDFEMVGFVMRGRAEEGERFGRVVQHVVRPVFPACRPIGLRMLPSGVSLPAGLA